MPKPKNEAIYLSYSTFMPKPNNEAVYFTSGSPICAEPMASPYHT